MSWATLLSSHITSGNCSITAWPNILLYHITSHRSLHASLACCVLRSEHHQCLWMPLFWPQLPFYDRLILCSVNRRHYWINAHIQEYSQIILFFLICHGLTSEWEPNFGGGKFSSWTADFAVSFVPRAEQFAGFIKVSSPHQRSFYPSVDPSVTAPAPQVGRANKSEIRHILPLSVRPGREDSTRWIDDVFFFLPHICQALFLTSWHLKSKSAGEKKQKPPPVGLNVLALLTTPQWRHSGCFSFFKDLLWHRHLY